MRIKIDTTGFDQATQILESLGKEGIQVIRRSVKRAAKGVSIDAGREVRKLYPDAELPSFEYIVHSPGKLEMIYRSNRPFADLAQGLIEGCGERFGETLVIERNDLPAEQGMAAQFILTRRA